MTSKKRITANLPADLLSEASKITDKGITETLTFGLELIKRLKAHDKAQKLKGKLSLDVDLDLSRERSRR